MNTPPAEQMVPGSPQHGTGVKLSAPKEFDFEDQGDMANDSLKAA
jgi:hypothetical protein